MIISESESQPARIVLSTAPTTMLSSRVRGTNRSFALVHSVRKRGIQARPYAARASHNKPSDELGSDRRLLLRYVSVFDSKPAADWWFSLSSF
jgi:hypothetical protein